MLTNLCRAHDPAYVRGEPIHGDAGQVPVCCIDGHGAPPELGNERTPGDGALKSIHRMGAERGIQVRYDSVRRRVGRFGEQYAAELRRQRGCRVQHQAAETGAGFVR